MAAMEPCVVCGEPTSIGTPLFSDRRMLPDGARLCALCNAKISAAHRGRRLTDEEVAQAIDNGTMAAITWANNHI